MNRLMAYVLSLAMLLTSLAVLPQEAKAEETFATRGQIIEFLLTQSAKYNPEISEGDIVKGYEDGNLGKSNPATRAETLVMLSRAFDDLSEPVGGMTVMMPEKTDFTNVPTWAEADIKNIQGSRIMTEAEPLDEYVSMDEVKLLVQRIHGALGESLKDDFYSAVNKEYIQNNSIMQGYNSEDNFTYLEREVNEDIRSLVDEIVKGSYEENTPEQKIADVYKNYLNYDAREKEGLAPIQKYIDALKSVKTLDELSDVCFNISEETAIDIFATFGMMSDFKDSKKKIMAFGTIGASQTKDFYNDKERQELFVSHYEAVLKMSGFDEEFSKEAALKVFDVEKELVKFEMEPQEYMDPEKTYNIYTLDELKAMIPNLDLDRSLAVSGYKAPDRIMVPDKAICEEFGRLYSEENLEQLKAIAITDFLSSVTPLLSKDFEMEVERFLQELYGIEGSLPDDQKALEIVKGFFGDYISSMYIDKYFSEEIKTDVEFMCRQFIDMYKERILKLSWMSDGTKQKAVGKLDKMSINVGYPLKYDTEAADKAIIKSLSEGGSFYDNSIALRLENRRKDVREQFLPNSTEFWEKKTYEANAFYNQLDNSINFLAGILQPPLYDPNAKAEERYGMIGAVIGHEITHAFDNNGAKFDENGNLSDWWTEEDYEAFSILNKDVINAFDEYEVYPGIENNGELTLSENIADLGGIACALSIIKTFDDPDYDAFFRGAASTWRSVCSRNTMEYYSVADEHSLTKARVNIAFGQFDEFYETYGITEGDYLYVAPEKRVGIW